MVCTLNQPIWFVWRKGEENLMSIKTRKIGIIGAGNVGSHLALQFAVQGLADEVVFYDINHDKATGESLDLLDAVSYQPHHFDAYAGTVRQAAPSGTEPPRHDEQRRRYEQGIPPDH